MQQIAHHDLNRFEQIRCGQDVLRSEANAVFALAEQLDESFCDAAESLLGCAGSVVVTGIGKAGIIGQKIAATLASTGTKSQFLHPSEAVHGDLGRVDSQDMVLALSFSGESEEVVRLIPHIHAFGIRLVALTGNPASTLGQSADVTLSIGPLREACPNGLAPSTSTTTMLALGDALSLLVSRMRNFQPQDFARFHPGGSLGRKLTVVDEVMRPLEQCRIARCDQTVQEVLVHVGRPGRRTGAIMLTDSGGKLCGVFTDSDLARLLEELRESALSVPVNRVMTVSPRSIPAGSRLSDAVVLLKKWKISELPVIDAAAKPRGLIDITDVVGIEPVENSSADTLETRRSA